MNHEPQGWTNLKEAYEVVATAKNRELVEGQTVILVKDVSEADRYGRHLSSCTGPDLDCGNFGTHSEAQAIISFVPLLATGKFSGWMAKTMTGEPVKVYLRRVNENVPVLC